jgi:serine phosphatase RsbU (regulator of sigma subunit)
VIAQGGTEWIEGAESAITVPMTSRRRTLGAFTIGEPTGSAADRALLEELGRRVGSALDNAISYGASRQLGLTLQRSLLPPRLDRVGTVDVAARYLPGVEGTEVGGDFYLSHALADGRLLLAMGDVVGRGVRAAARMGQLRAALAALAYDGAPVGEVLGQLSVRASDVIDVSFATVLLAHYDPATRALTYASAGHPPPVLAARGEEPRYLDVHPSPPIGTAAGPAVEQVAVLPPSSTLVLYTDGLVEGRTVSLSEGLERLRRALRDVNLPADDVCDHLLHGLGVGTGTADDIAMLVVTHR